MIIKSNFMPIDLYNKFIGNDSELKDKPISIFNDYIPTIEELSINPYNILIIIEPNQLFGLHKWAIENSHYFSCILTWGQEILDTCSNSLLLPFGTAFTHAKDKYKELELIEKEYEISFICGSKTMIEGQQLRQKIYSKQNQINIPTKWFYTTTEPKDICFKNSMFHIAIENSQNKNFFTEKIVDAFLCKTLPIYWGCPNIGEYFDDRGIITFNNENELVNIVNSLTEEDYHSRKEYIEKNAQTALYYAEYFMRCKDIIKEIIKINNI
jgi:hypothetical protein